MRLNRYMSMAGVSSRRKGETLIRDGRISVNGVTVTDPAFRVDVDADTVTFDGRPLTPVREDARRYIILNKPTGVIVSRGDTHGRATVFDLLGEGMESVFPVGRLDADTSGVLLLTDDGDLAYRLTHPSFGVEKVYRAEVSGKVTDEDVDAFAGGIELDDGPAAPARMTIIDSGEDVSLVTVIMHQGRKRQVRRMLEKIGHPVRVLERISFGGINAENLPLGSYRMLAPEEVRRLKETGKNKK